MADSGARAQARCALARSRRLSFAFLVFVFCTPAVGAPVCVPDHVDAKTRVADVYDGDTVHLGDHRRLRLIGLDTPELGRDGTPNEPLAAAARDALNQRLAADGTLQLRYDTERQDVHGRALAHAFFADGDSVAAWLLERGLATLLVIPPDVWNADCYAAAERHARSARRGLWALPAYKAVAADALPPATHGYRVVRGRVLRINEAPHAVWLALQGRFAIRIDRDDLRYFSAMPLHDLRRREVEVRGRVYPVGDELHLKLRHPAYLERVTP